MQSQQACYAKRTPVAAIRKAMAGRTVLRMNATVLRMDSMAASDPRSMGVLPTEFSRLRPTRLPGYPLQAILR